MVDWDWGWLSGLCVGLLTLPSFVLPILFSFCPIGNFLFPRGDDLCSRKCSLVIFVFFFWFFSITPLKPSYNEERNSTILSKSLRDSALSRKHSTKQSVNVV